MKTYQVQLQTFLGLEFSDTLELSDTGAKELWDILTEFPNRSGITILQGGVETVYNSRNVVSVKMIQKKEEAEHE